MVIQYKCPDCGADMNFDSNTGMLLCESCGHTDNIEHMQNPNSNPNQQDEPIYDYEDFVNETQYSTFNSDEAVQYQCPNCGAVLITDKDTVATTCSFCQAGMVLGDRLTGKLAPSKVIPFKISKQEAQEAFRKWCKKGLLTPKGFMSADRIKSIQGVYVPFWLFDLHAHGETHAECTRVHSYTQGDYDVTETSYYDVFRKADLCFDRIPCDASEKMDDKLMDKLEPFHYNELKTFQTPYLAGYLAEKYNYTDQDLFPRIQKRGRDYTTEYLRNSISGYNTVSLHHTFTDIQQRNADYTLLPIWMICYDYQNGEHTFAMNGQTGKVVGKPPISKGKVAAWFGGLSAISFVALRVVTMILGGPIL